MSYTFETDGKRVMISHPAATKPIVVESWSWQSEAFRQLLFERDALRLLIKQARPLVVESLGSAIADGASDTVRYGIGALAASMDVEMEKSP